MSKAMTPTPSRRQIVFNWLMGEDDFATRVDGYWGGTEEVAAVDALLAALDGTAKETNK